MLLLILDVQVWKATTKIGCAVNEECPDVGYGPKVFVSEPTHRAAIRPRFQVCKVGTCWVPTSSQWIAWRWLECVLVEVYEHATVNC